MTYAPIASEREAVRPPYRWAVAAGFVVFAIYLLTLAPTTAFWDTSEYIAAAKGLGIPHPPGNPLFVILAHTFGQIPFSADYAVRINIFAALTSAAAAGLWFLVAERWLQTMVSVRWVRLLAAFAGTFVGAMAWTVWNQSTVNEKVYTVSLLSIALTTWLMVRWGDTAPGPKRDRLVVLMVYLTALTATNHLMGVLAAPAVGLFILWTDWRVLTRWQVLAAIVGAVLVGISVNYFFLPMRAAQYPAINEGEPIGFFSPALMDVLNRAQYGKPSVFQRQADFVGQLSNYLQYWGWQFARDWPTALRTLATVIFTLLGLSGLVELIRRDRRAGWTALALFGTLTVALIFYLNFKYGFSQYPGQPELPREVRERDYFFVASFQMFGVFVALGFGALAQGIVGFLRDRGSSEGRWALATPVFALALVPLIGNHVTAPRSHERLARDFAADMLNTVAPNAILITAGDNDTFPLWYAQEVEGIRPDVTLANLSLMNTRWHLHQLRRREHPGFDPATADGYWGKVAPATPQPDTPVLSLTEAQLDSLPEVMPAPKGGLHIGGLDLRINQDYLLLQDVATLFLIRDNIGKRPIYFAWSDGLYPDQTFGLAPYLVTEGLARRLNPGPVAEQADSIVLVQGMGYMNMPVTRGLMWNVYHWQSAARNRPRGWVDAPSSSILTLYQIVYSAGADMLRSHDLPKEAERADSIARAVEGQIPRGPH